MQRSRSAATCWRGGSSSCKVRSNQVKVVLVWLDQEAVLPISRFPENLHRTGSEVLDCLLLRFMEVQFIRIKQDPVLMVLILAAGFWFSP